MTPSNEPTQAAGALISESERARITSSVRMTFALIAMVALIVAGLTGLIFYLVSSVFDSLTPAVARDLEWKVRRGAVELSKTAELGILVGDEVTVRNAARDYLNSPDVVNVVVTGATGNVVFAHGDDVPHVLGVLQRPSGQVYAFDGRLVAWAPATIEGGEVGRVAVAMSTARLEAGDALRRQISWTAIAGSVFAMLLALGFVSLYIWPVLRLTQAAFVRLEHTTEQALEAARLKAQFLANMSHEIRTPMNAVVGLSKLMLGMQLNTKLRRYAEMIEASSRALLSIINDILDFSKLEAGKYQIIAAPTELAQVVQEVAELLAERAHEKGLDLVYRIAPEVPRVVEVDGDRVRQVLMNLVGNAIKFTERGEVYILVEAKALADERVELKISVQDTGPGVPPDLQAQIFEAFSQGDGSLVRKHGGTGLGLTISKEMVRLMGGGMGLESQQGKGSTFWFWLPGRVLDPVSAVRGQAASLGARALITCPNEHARTTITEHVVAWGMEAQAAATATQTQEVLRGAAQANQQFDVVIIAETQSGGSGSETVQAVRGLERERMPIVLLTYTRPELEPANTQDEVTAQLTQPVRMSDLYNTLASVLKPGSVRPANKQVKEASLRFRGV
ncbi:MAG TPA: ATP-binding protein, partial [Polyangiales bacterium]